VGGWVDRHAAHDVDLSLGTWLGTAISFQLLGKNLLGATGPSPGFAGIDYPLSPRAFLLQVTLRL
jgi:hypothetical protein